MRKLFTIILIHLLIGSVVFSQSTGRAKIMGTIIDQDGKPLPDVVIKMYSLRAATFHRPFAKSDANGKWRVMYLRGGRWRVDFEKVGYTPVRLNVELAFVEGKYRPFISGKREDKVEIKMKKLEGPALDKSIINEIEQAKVLLADKKGAEALQKFSEILEKNKELEGITLVYLYIGNCHALLGDYKKAIENYKIAQNKYPDNKELILSIGNSYNNLKDYDKAMEWFNKLEIDEITNEDTLYNIGVIFYNLSQFDKALQYFSKAIEVNETFAEAYFQLGMTYTAMDKPDDAVKILKKFMEMAPDSPNYQTAKAIIDAFSQ
jgi:tetratricopeptide (TPR) repeat protein